ncbi:hypothetical protein ABG768_004837, partial [Culter alburnus]
MSSNVWKDPEGCWEVVQPRSTDGSGGGSERRITSSLPSIHSRNATDKRTACYDEADHRLPQFVQPDWS